MKKIHYFSIMSLLVFAFSFAQPCADLFISEYIEGSGNNKIIEIYNPTGADILLTGTYDLQLYYNGSGAAGATINLIGTIASNDVFIIENPGEALGIPEDQQSTLLNFNGDDAVVLRNATVDIDVIGQIGFDPGFQWLGAVCSQGTQNGTLVRNIGVQNGDNDGTDVFDPDAEWTCFDIDNFADIGFHSNSCVPSSELQLQLPVGTDITCGFSYDFGNQFIGTETDITIRIQNIGAADLNITGIALANNTDYSLLGVPGLPLVLAPGTDQDITVRFNPSVLGVLSDSLTIISDDANEGSCVVDLNGVGNTTCGATTTVIVTQDFESAATDTWNYTPNHGPIVNYWYVTNSLTNIPGPQSVTNFWGMTDLERAGHFGFPHEITFDPVDVSAYNNVELSFYYYTVELDLSDSLEYEVLFDGVSQGLVDISANTLAWTQVVVNVPDSVTLVQMVLYADLDAANDQAGLDNVTLSSSSLNTTTWDGANWDNGFPDNTVTAIINGLYNTATSGSIDACSLLVTAGNTLSVQGTDYINVVNDVTIEGAILVATDANFVQINDASSVKLNGAGIGSLQKSTTPIDDYYDYTYWSSPFTNETIGSALMGVPANRIFSYDAANFDDADNDDFDDTPNDWIVAGQTDIMIPGKGYAAIADAFGMLGVQTFTFDGQFNNGIINPSVTVSPDPADANWNFLGNPYPSGVNLDTFLAHPDNSGLLGTVYLWTHVTPADINNPGNQILNFSEDDYASYNLTGPAYAVNDPAMRVPTNILASGQGFFIEAMQTAPATATFNNSMRVTAGNDNFFRATDRIWLNLENDQGAFSQILIGFVEGATDGVDRLYDGKRLDGGNLISFYSLIEDERFAIQGRSALTEEEIVPLGIKNLVEGDNEYKISIDNIEGLLETSEILLFDDLLGITHDLHATEYRFQSEEGIYNERFQLILKTDLIDESVEEELLITRSQVGSFQFSTSYNSGISQIQVFDLLGRQLYNINSSDSLNDQEIKMDALTSSIFIIKATLTNGKVLTKKAVN